MKLSDNTIQMLIVAQRLFPFLDRNLASANKEYMDGQIAKGAFNYALSRHGNAAFAIGCVNLETGEVDEKAFRDNKIPDGLEDEIGGIISMMCMDLRTYAQIDLELGKQADQKKEIKIAAQRKECLDGVDEIDAFLVKLGFTDVNPIFKIRVKPKVEASAV